MFKNRKFGWLLSLCGLLLATQHADAAQGNWTLVTHGPAGPIVNIHVASSGNVHMGALISFEYERKCDPIFSYIEYSGPLGAPLGTPTSARRINNPNLGVIHNGRFYTWHMAKIQYRQGFEVGFGVTRELWQALTGSTTSLTYVREDGTQIQLPVYGLNEKLLQGLNYCRSRV